MSILKRAYPRFFHHGVRDIAAEIGPGDTVLDVGCGYNSPLKHCEHAWSLGIDLFDGYLQASERAGIHSEYMKTDATTVEFEPDSFDVVLCAQVIEHLTRDDAWRLMEKMEAWARRKVIITTPNGFLPKDACHDNIHQEHLSGWTADDLRQRGYSVKGISGMKVIRERCMPTMFWRRVFDLSSRFIFLFPGQAFQLLAVKKTGPGR
jgi:2-polyprenyl-3-methyl-5-hydroxy-6-metoxy-1,4-benzoquinol methylase